MTMRLFFFFFQDRALRVSQVVLELTILWPQPPKYWDYMSESSRLLPCAFSLKASCELDVVGTPL